MSNQVGLGNSPDTYLFFSGDLVQEGGNIELYRLFHERFDRELNNLGIPFERRFCVPGNHDVSVPIINEKGEEHEGIVSQKLSEKAFNDYVSKQPNILKTKFKNYFDFASKFSKYGVMGESFTGTSHNLTDSISVYCLNTAICSSGGLNRIKDEKRLSIDTRNLQAWATTNTARVKILMMHHPLEMLTEWSRAELKILLENKISLCLSGHNHQQSVYHSFVQNTSLVKCSAPPLLTHKRGDLGYAIITLSQNGVDEIRYRQWIGANKFVRGVGFAANDDGVVKIQRLEEQVINDVVYNILSERLNKSLESFKSQPKIWIEPILRKNDSFKKSGQNTGSSTVSGSSIVSLSDLISNPTSTIIQAPPQFGLTCLAHYLAKEAWRNKGALWLYLDVKNDIKWYSVEKNIASELRILGLEDKKISCLLLDSWKSSLKDSGKIVNSLIKKYPDIPIIIFNTIDNTDYFDNQIDEPIEGRFERLHLTALPKSQIRRIVSEYNDSKTIGDEDVILTKVVSDLEVLNIHRTPHNCLTLLKVAEIKFDESPVNRTEMINRVLFLLFNVDSIPNYSGEKPDLKDCEFVLGHLCEFMIRTSTYSFTRSNLIARLQSYADMNVMYLNNEMVFDILVRNNILVCFENEYRFRFTYWVFYFAAHRMHQSPEFFKYVFEGMKYAAYPEIIEFYTGIDRRREDALVKLIQDIESICETVEKKCGLPEEMNPYKHLHWNPTDENLAQMKGELSEGVINSRLPNLVKDQYSDSGYNEMRPYNQGVLNILEEYSLLMLMQCVSSGARALRNSDFVNPEIKRQLLQVIMKSWEQISKVLLALAPLLAQRGAATFQGAGFELDDTFNDVDEVQRVIDIMFEIQSNVVDWYKDDIYSRKMGPLLSLQYSSEENELKRHKLILLIIKMRPNNWSKDVQKYIESTSKGSFFLYDVVLRLRREYSYGYLSTSGLREIAHLIKMSIAKHETKDRKVRISEISDSVLPDREVDQDNV